MKIYRKITALVLVGVLSTLLIACGLGSKDNEVMDGGHGIGIDTETINHIEIDSPADGDAVSNISEEAYVTSPGPNGEIKLSLPEGWKAEVFGVSENEAHSEEYGFILGKVEETEKAVLMYCEMFGVCGTGMTFEDTEIAGAPASIGYENGNSFWGYVALSGSNEGIVLLMEDVTEDWWKANREALLGMLETVNMDTFGGI